MRSSRLPAASAGRRPAAVRLISNVVLVLFMGNLTAMVDAVFHPARPYFGTEHLLTGGVTALATIFLLGALEVYLGRRVQLEEAYRASEERLLAAQKMARLGSYVITLPTGELSSSKTLDDILGRGEDDRRDVAAWLGLILPEERQGMRDWFASAAQGKEVSFDRVLRIVRKSDQRVRWVHVLGTVEFDAARRPVRITGTMQDITERKRGELEREVLHEIAGSIAMTANLDDLLQLMHRSLKRVLDAENCFVALHDPKTGLFSFPYFADQFDTAPAPAPLPESCTAYVFRHGEPAIISLPLFHQLQEQGEIALVGSQSPSWMGVPLRTPRRTIGVLVLQDYERENLYGERDLRFLAEVGNQAAIVIERRQAVVALRDREAELRVILESTADGILAIDAQGKVIRTNQRFADLWRIPPSVLDSRDDDALLHHVLDQLVDPEGFLARVKSLYGSAAESHDTLRFKDGRVFERHSTPIMVDGQVGGRVSSFHDVTARKQAEETAATLATQFQHAQRMESIGLLAGGVAHEFNNMLAAILGNTEFALLRVDAAEPLHADLQAVQTAALRAAELTRQLLAFARQLPAEPVALNLNETLPTMLSMLRQALGADISLAWQPAETLWPVTMDPSLMDQMLTNLCLNARAAIPHVGSVTISTANCVVDAAFCETHATAVPGEFVRLTVADTGVGMDANTLARIFDPFFTTKAVGKGTGLGLAMVYGAVKQHGGFITVTSAPGEGATFEIYLPRHAGG